MLKMWRLGVWKTWARARIDYYVEHGIPTEDEIYEAGADAMYEPAYEKGRRDEREALRGKGLR